VQGLPKACSLESLSSA